MGKVSAAPTTPPKGTSPSKSIQRAVDTAWHPKSSTSAQEAISNDNNSIRKPVPTGGKE